jgi:hypothetical protein
VIAQQSREGGSEATFLQDCSLEPPRRFAPPLLTQEGSHVTQNPIRSHLHRPRKHRDQSNGVSLSIASHA